MLSENCVVVGWSWTPGSASVACERSELWRDLDRQLKAIAKRRAALDADELALIREAVRVQLWRPLGMISMREYLERRMGYGPQVAAERLRVAEALDALPVLEAALERGELSYSAVRELTRIATAKTEAAWVKTCRGLAVRQIEEMVGEREVGDAPESEPKPHVRRHRLPLDLRPSTYARYREARKVFCRSTQNLDAHHLVHREHGGTHDLENLTTLCDGHHKAHHRGQLVIRGHAPDIEVTWVAEVPRVGEPEIVEQARSVLRNLGCTRTEAASAVERAVACVGDAELEPLIRAALQQIR